MSRVMNEHEYIRRDIFIRRDVFKLGSRVSFLHNGVRLDGVVMRENSPIYQVEVDGLRYEVNRDWDEMTRLD